MWVGSCVWERVDTDCKSGQVTRRGHSYPQQRRSTILALSFHHRMRWLSIRLEVPQTRMFGKLSKDPKCLSLAELIRHTFWIDLALGKLRFSFPSTLKTHNLSFRQLPSPELDPHILTFAVRERKDAFFFYWDGSSQ